MPVHFRCPCGVVLNAPEGGAGKGGECPACGKVVVVPANAVDIAEDELGAPAAAAPAAAPALEPVPTSTPPPRRAATPVPKRMATPVPKRAVTPVPTAAAPVEEAAEIQLAVPGDGPLEAVGDEDLLPADALEIVDDGVDDGVEDAIVDAAVAEPVFEAEEAVAVPESLSALDDLGVADAEPLDEADGVAQGEEPAMAIDRKARRGTDRASRRSGGRTGRTRRPRKCPECNSENEPGVRECTNCGASLRGKPSKKGGLTKILVILVVIVVVAGGGAFAAGFFAFDSMPASFQNIWKSMGLPHKGAAETEKAPEPEAEPEEPKAEEPTAEAEKPPAGYVPDTGDDDVEDAPSASGDSMIGLGGVGIATPDATPDLGGGGPAAPALTTGGESGIDE